MQVDSMKFQCADSVTVILGDLSNDAVGCIPQNCRPPAASFDILCGSSVDY